VKNIGRLLPDDTPPSTEAAATDDSSGQGARGPRHRVLTRRAAHGWAARLHPRQAVGRHAPSMEAAATAAAGPHGDLSTASSLGAPHTAGAARPHPRRRAVLAMDPSVRILSELTGSQASNKVGVLIIRAACQH